MAPAPELVTAAAGLLGMTADQLQARLAAPTQPEKLLSRRQAAEHLGVSTKCLQTWDNQGKLQPLRLGYHTLRYRQSDIDKLLNATRQKGEQD